MTMTLTLFHIAQHPKDLQIGPALKRKVSFQRFLDCDVTAALDSCHGFLHLALYVNIVLALVVNVRLFTSVLVSSVRNQSQSTISQKKLHSVCEIIL